MIRFSTDLSLQKIISLKPFFFFYTPFLKKKIFFKEEIFLYFSQEKDEIVVEHNAPEVDSLIEQKLKQCFGISEDLSPFYELVKEDPILSPFYKQIVNTTILSAMTPYEALLGGIASQNTTFSRYLQLMRGLEKISFNPSLVDEKFLLKEGFGYKAKFISKIPSIPDLLEPQKYDGVGQYTEDLLDIFQNRNFSAFYCDVLIKKIVNENYKKINSNEELIDFAKARWGKWRGLMEVYLQKFLSDIKQP